MSVGMASMSSGTLFGSHHRRGGDHGVFGRSGPMPPCSAAAHNSVIHTGPMGGLSANTSSVGFATDTNNSREYMHWNVVKENDASRGFRMFDGVLLSVKDVSSEELFLERMKIAYSAYEAYVAELVDKSPLEITRGLVQAVSACLVKYFSTQSMLRTNRPFIAKTLNLDCQDMLCTHSDFIQSFLFTNASPDDEAIISLAEKVYNERNFDVCGDPTTTTVEQDGSGDGAGDQLFDFVMRLAERNVIGGTNVTYGLPPSNGDGNTTGFSRLSEDLPFQSRKDGTGRSVDGGTTAMLILMTDFEALHNYVAYVLYLTPVQLSRRYNVNFDSLRNPNHSATTTNIECSSAREARKRRRQDNTKVVIRSVIEKKRREKIDTMVERSAACQATLQQRATQMVRRNNDVLCHVLLMLFDKCLTGLIDKGFENLNTRRGYAVSSAKEIGAATIYTGIIDTVGEVSTRVEGYTFDNIIKNATTNVEMENNDREQNHQPPQLRFSFPLNSVVTEVTGSKEKQTTSTTGGGSSDEEHNHDQ